MNAAKFDVLGIGNAIVDILAKVEDDFLDAHAITKGAMQLIDEDQATRLYADMTAGVEISGGSAANTIAGIALLGGMNLDLKDPIFKMGFGIADGDGVATMNQFIPGGAPLITVGTQAIIRRGSGGSESVKSNFITAPVLP